MQRPWLGYRPRRLGLLYYHFLGRLFSVINGPLPHFPFAWPANPLDILAPAAISSMLSIALAESTAGIRASFLTSAVLQAGENLNRLTAAAGSLSADLRDTVGEEISLARLVSHPRALEFASQRTWTELVHLKNVDTWDAMVSDRLCSMRVLSSGPHTPDWQLPPSSTTHPCLFHRPNGSVFSVGVWPSLSLAIFAAVMT